MYQVYQDGFIEVITGPMFAGKSEELLRRLTRLEYAKKDYICFKPAIDSRSGISQIVSRNGKKTKAIEIKDVRDILKHVTEKHVAVLIDEVQFFDKQLVDIIEQLADGGKRVIVSGLGRDFRGEPFGIMPELMARAEFVTKLTSICMVCGAPATRTQRLIKGKPAKYDDPIVMVGDTESYEPRCRQHHIVEK